MADRFNRMPRQVSEITLSPGTSIAPNNLIEPSGTRGDPARHDTRHFTSGKARSSTTNVLTPGAAIADQWQASIRSA
jgi:hypothetical protein